MLLTKKKSQNEKKYIISAANCPSQIEIRRQIHPPASVRISPFYLALLVEYWKKITNQKKNVVEFTLSTFSRN